MTREEWRQVVIALAIMLALVLGVVGYIAVTAWQARQFNQCTGCLYPAGHP